MADTASLVVRVSGQGVDSTAKSLDSLTRSSAKTSKAVDDVGASSNSAAVSVSDLGVKTSATSAKINDSSQSAEKYITSLKNQAAAIGLNSEELAVFNAKLLGANASQLEAAAAAARQIASEKAKVAAIDEASRAELESASKALAKKEAIESTIQAMRSEIATMAMSGKERALYSASIAGATEAQKREIARLYELAEANSRAASSSSSMAMAANNASKGIPRVGTVAQQAGYQLQDMIVQIQGGTSAFVAIGQQVPQFLGAFGPIGAITGTIIAMGSALLGVAYNASKAESDVSALVAAGQRLANLNLDSLVQVNDISREFTSSERIAKYKALSDEVINLSQAYENQGLETKRLFAELQAATDNMSKIGGFFGDTQAEASAKLQEKQAQYNESLRAEAEIRSKVNALKEKQNALSDEEAKIKSDAEKAPAVQQKVDDRASRQAEAEAKRMEIQKTAAAQYLTQLQQSNMTELQLIDSQEQQKLSKIQEYRANDLITAQQYQDALLEIETNAKQSRIDLRTQEIDEYYKLMGESRKAEIAAREKEAADKEKILDDGISAQRNMTSDLKSVLGEQNEIYKASAIVTATIDTYKAATAAYAALVGIPIVGPGLAIAASGAAITAGLANVAAIAGAREQGGGMVAGSAYQMAERGKAEIIVPAGASRARTAAQMKQIMGENGGSSPSSVVIVNQTTGRIDSVQQERTDDGQLRLIIREQMAIEAGDENSPFTKTRRATRQQPGFM